MLNAKCLFMSTNKMQNLGIPPSGNLLFIVNFEL
jgi:hypothetical protein